VIYRLFTEPIRWLLDRVPLRVAVRVDLLRLRLMLLPRNPGCRRR
jgi:hypothetical protein